LPNAVTLTIAAARTAKFVGPAIGGLAIAAFGEAVPYLLNAVSFLGLMFAVLAMRPTRQERAGARASFVSELRAGFAEVRRTPIISGIMQLEAVFGVLQVNEVMITIVARSILGLGPEGLGLLLAAPAFGSVAGVVALVAVGQVRRVGRFAVISLAVYAAAMLAIATSLAVALTFIALAATGLLDAWITVVRHSILQLAAPGEMRGRVMANMNVVASGVAPLSQVQSGVLTGLLGPSPAIVAAAITLVSVSTVIVVRNRVVWTFEHRRDEVTASRP
jgi:hypothetical protein